MYPPGTILEGENFVIEHIEKEGAVFLENAFGDLALSVQGNYYIGFQTNKYVMITAEMEEGTQYVKPFAKDSIRARLHPHTLRRTNSVAAAAPLLVPHFVGC